MPEPHHLILMGRVGRTHGLLGEVVVIPSSDDPSRLALLNTVWIGRDINRVQAFEIESHRLHTRKVGTASVIKFKDIKSLDELGKIKGCQVFASESDLVLDKDELFFHDLIGCSVSDTSGSLIGNVVDVKDIGSQMLLEVKKTDDSLVQIPYIDVFVKKVDEKNGEIVIDPIDGLI